MASAGRGARAPVALQLIAQPDFTIAPGAPLDLTVEVPALVGIDALLDAPEASSRVDVVVTAYTAVVKREDVWLAVTGVLPRPVDSLDVPIDAVGRPSSGELSLSVPTSVDRSKDALQLGAAGVYPVVVDVRVDGQVTAELITFVNRGPGPDDAPLSPLPITLGMGIDTPIVLDDDGNVLVTDDTIAQLTELADALEASAMPATVQLPPRLLSAVRNVDPALVDRLVQALADSDVTAAPTLPLDPSAAAAAGQTGLYTQWLRDGEDALGEELPNPPTRIVQFVEGPTSQAGAGLLRDLGTRLLALTPAVYNSTIDTIGIGFTDTSQVVRVRLGDGALLDAIIVDRAISETLSEPVANPLLAAIYSVADLLGFRQQIHDRGTDPGRHGVLIGTDALGIPDPRALGPLTELIAGTAGLTVSSLERLSGKVDSLLLDGVELRIGFPEATDATIEPRIATKTALEQSIASTASMLVADDPRPARWMSMVSTIPSSAVTDRRVDIIAFVVQSELREIREAVEPPTAFKFSLTGRTSEIRLRFRNNSDTPLRVLIKLSSAKLTFPDGEQIEVLEPKAVTEVEVKVEARSNGQSGVSLEVLTPAGDRLAPTVPLTANVTALNGLGNLVSGAALLILLAWWGSHMRRNLRRKRTAAAAARHPVRLNSDADESLDRRPDTPSLDALSPDAEASTLPPS